MSALERLKARRAVERHVDSILLKDSRPSHYALFCPVFYFARGTVTVGVTKRPEEGWPLSPEAWRVLSTYAKRCEALPMLRFWDMVSEAVRATWEATVGGVVDEARALSIFEQRQRRLRVEPVRTDSGVTVHHFNLVG